MKRTLRFVKVLSFLVGAFVTIVLGDMAVEHFAAINFETTKMTLEAIILVLMVILIGGIVIVILSKEESLSGCCVTFLKLRVCPKR